MAITIKDYFIARFQIIGVPMIAERIEQFLTAQGVDGSLDFETANKNDNDVVFLQVVFDLLVAPDISEDDYSIRYDKNALMSWYKAEAKRLGVEDLISGSDSEVSDMSFLA